jgi:hypothetical protein
MLGLAFFLVVTPLAWVRRRVAADPLQRQFVREATTYWESRKARTPESYFKEF